MFDFLSEKFSSIFSTITGKGSLTAAQIEQVVIKVEEALIEADVPYQVVKQFISEFKSEIIHKKITSSLKPEEHIMKALYDKVAAFLGARSTDESWSVQLPSVIMVMGLQGSGKTTTCAKLAYYIQEQARKRNKSRKILLASVDYYRPAALEQLEINARQVGIDFYKANALKPQEAAREIFTFFQKNNYECLILDTAGRLHIDEALLAELKGIDAGLKPKYKFLVLDAMTGQESLAVARQFEEKIGFSHILLTKMDSQTRAGAVFAFKYMLKKDILFIGTGEKTTDFELFRPQRMASRLLGMGDMMTLVERAQEKIKESESQRMYSSLKEGRLTLDDFAAQLEMMGRLGSLSSLMKLMPGGGAQVSEEALSQGEQELKKFKAMVHSMTLKERLNPVVLDQSRKERIARGSGVKVQDVNLLLERFEQTQQFVKIFKKMGKLNPFFK